MRGAAVSPPPADRRRLGIGAPRQAAPLREAAPAAAYSDYASTPSHTARSDTLPSPPPSHSWPYQAGTPPPSPPPVFGFPGAAAPRPCAAPTGDRRSASLPLSSPEPPLALAAGRRGRGTAHEEDRDPPSLASRPAGAGDVSRRSIQSMLMSQMKKWSQEEGAAAARRAGGAAAPAPAAPSPATASPTAPAPASPSPEAAAAALRRSRHQPLSPPPRPPPPPPSPDAVPGRVAAAAQPPAAPPAAAGAWQPPADAPVAAEARPPAGATGAPAGSPAAQAAPGPAAHRPQRGYRSASAPPQADPEPAPEWQAPRPGAGVAFAAAIQRRPSAQGPGAALVSLAPRTPALGEGAPISRSCSVSPQGSRSSSPLLRERWLQERRRVGQVRGRSALLRAASLATTGGVSPSSPLRPGGGRSSAAGALFPATPTPGERGAPGDEALLALAGDWICDGDLPFRIRSQGGCTFFEGLRPLPSAPPELAEEAGVEGAEWAARLPHGLLWLWRAGHGLGIGFLTADTGDMTFAAASRAHSRPPAEPARSRPPQPCDLADGVSRASTQEYADGCWAPGAAELSLRRLRELQHDPAPQLCATAPGPPRSPGRSRSPGVGRAPGPRDPVFSELGLSPPAHGQGDGGATPGPSRRSCSGTPQHALPPRRVSLSAPPPPRGSWGAVTPSAPAAQWAPPPQQYKSVLERALEYEDSQSPAAPILHAAGAVLAMPDDRVPVVPADAPLWTQPEMDWWCRHPAAPVILALFERRGMTIATDRAYIGAVMTGFVLGAVLRMMHGTQMTKFNREGTSHRRFFAVKMETTAGKQHLPFFCWAHHETSNKFSERLCLSELFGVQRDCSSPGFAPHLYNKDFIRAPQPASNRRALMPTRNCFTLWFHTGTGARSVDLLANKDRERWSWVNALEVLRVINSPDRNYTLSAYQVRSRPSRRNGRPGADGGRLPAGYNSPPRYRLTGSSPPRRRGSTISASPIVR
eukprot:TRINITY_DN15482_c0_g1_i5.p1 TRINITY_DN15482_c0_g1~~TRINITY_DN15482_c0_g1_i5.p1  ORF type:complete len:979 (+),score=194.40 TRINITY_DN15482_c0_g1_i5:80-3016(+)